MESQSPSVSATSASVALRTAAISKVTSPHHDDADISKPAAGSGAAEASSARKYASRPLTRWAIAYYFFILGLFEGVFSGILPAFKEAHHMSESQLSYMLLIVCVGAMCSMFAATPICKRFGTAAAIDIPTFLMAALFPFLMLAPSTVMAVFWATFWGIFAGFIEIPCNSQAILFETVMGSSSMGFFHASFAGGAVFGSILVGLLIYAGLAPASICSIIGVGVFLANLFFRRALIQHDVEKEIEREVNLNLGEGNFELATAHKSGGDGLTPRADMDAMKERERDSRDPEAAASSRGDLSAGAGAGKVKRSLSVDLSQEAEEEEAESDDATLIKKKTAAKGRLQVLVASLVNSVSKVVPKKWVVLSALTAVSFLSWMLEGSVGDWSGLYNIQVLGVSSASATMPFAVYQASLVLGRAGYDYIVDRYISRKNMIMMNGLIGAFGLAIVVLAGLMHDSVSFPLNLLGFGISGLGMSTLWPIVTSWCGNIDGVDMTYAVSVVNGVSYCALLAGPPVLGFIAEATGSLTYSFATAAGLCLLCIPLAAFLQ